VVLGGNCQHQSVFVFYHFKSPESVKRRKSRDFSIFRSLVS